MKPANRVIFNTSVLYTRLLIGMVLGLFTIRLVLGALGEADYGIYTLVAGVIGMLGILNSSMSNASMRFMAHSLGTGNEDIIKKTFNTTLYLHFIIGIIVIAIMEVGGYFMFEYLLNIPAEKVMDAKIVYQFMVVTSFITIISVPYDAVINSHENILALSIVDLLGNIFSLVIAIYLTYCDSNRLVLYGFLMLLAQIILRIIKQLYSRSKYLECKIDFKNYVDKEFSKTILSFSGWNLFGSIAAMSVTQVKSIFLNMFFGVKVNTADGISANVSGQVNMISVSMTRALNPQLVKSEGRGDRQKMLQFTEMATKFAIFLFAIIAIPVVFETPYLLTIWLKDVPQYAIIFCRLLLIGILIEKFTFEITTAIRAIGNIRNLTVVESILFTLNIPITYIVFSLGYPPYSVYFINILISFLVFFNRLYFGKKIAGMSIKSFLKNGILPVLLPIILTLISVFIIYNCLSESFLRLVITSLTSFIVMTITFWFFGLKESETLIFKQIFNSIIQKIGLKNTNNK